MAQLELGLALRGLGAPEADVVRGDAQERLEASHPGATRRHRGLLSADWNAIEREIDCVEY